MLCVVQSGCRVGRVCEGCRRLGKPPHGSRGAGVPENLCEGAGGQAPQKNKAGTRMHVQNALLVQWKVQLKRDVFHLALDINAWGRLVGEGDLPGG